MTPVSGRAMRRVGWTLCAISIVSAPITVLLMSLAGRLETLIESYGATNALVGLCYGGVGLLLIKAEPRNRLVWFFVLAGFFTAIPGVFNGVLELLAQSQGVSVQDLDADRLEPALRYGYSLWVVGAFGLPTLGLLLAPDGRLLSPRWRGVAGASLVSIAVLYAAFAAVGSNTEAVDDGSWPFLLMSLGFPILLVLIAASFGSLLLRYRRSPSPVRRQLRWVLLGSAFVAIGGLGSLLSGPWITVIFPPLFAICYGMAIWRDQLFDVDLVISRALIYTSTLAVITGIYVLIVFGVGSLFGQASEEPSVLPIVATALIALIFQPARGRLERLANRLVFGRRATPYDVLSNFTRRVAATDAALLDNVAHNITDGTAATAASVWSLKQGILQPVSVWPPSGELGESPAMVDALSGGYVAPSATYTHPIDHDGQTIGLLGLTLPSDEGLGSADQLLIADLADGIGLALWNRRLTAQLRSVIDELQASRRRLVAVQDDVRHQLERDLHDGAQQRLVAIKVRLSIARQIADKQGATDTAAALAKLCVEADETIESLRDFARGVYPPLLESEGIVAAMEAHFSRSTLAVKFTPKVDRHHGRDIEATLYFAVLEILAALERDRHSASVEITMVEKETHLQLTVEVHPERGSPGTEKAPASVSPPMHVIDRVEAIAGTIESSDRPDGATAILIRVPVEPAHSMTGDMRTGDSTVGSRRLVSA